ncbi:MAG: class I SAM-dependent methyltransferase [Chloroflexota bacterium]
MTDAFAERVFTDVSTTMLTMLACLGDRLDLFKALAASGPATPDQLAEQAGINARYAREWLSAMAAGGYVSYDPASGSFSLPSAHVPVLAEENGRWFCGGPLQELLAMMGLMHQYTNVFRHGGGVPQSAFSQDMWTGLERESAVWFDNVLVAEWIGKAPGVRPQLERGTSVADVGCGRGRALIRLAQAFPNSRFTGYDVFGPAVEQASECARAEGVADRVHFEQIDASEGLQRQHNLILSFDVVHDAADPLAFLCSIRKALAPKGRYLCLEPRAGERLEENLSLTGAMWYAASTMYCMTTSLANGGAGLGAMGMPEVRLRELCLAAGFAEVTDLEVDDPLVALYEIRAVE